MERGFHCILYIKMYGKQSREQRREEREME